MDKRGELYFSRTAETRRGGGGLRADYKGSTRLYRHSVTVVGRHPSHGRREHKDGVLSLSLVQVNIQQRIVITLTWPTVWTVTAGIDVRMLPLFRIGRAWENGVP